jgi:NAD(P)-dependent dehydrogenase (short-subunit alcohol dehydrogenase family)
MNQVSMNRVMLITGAGRGIGAATARLAARDGYDVAINFSASELAASKVADECRTAGVAATLVHGDVASESDVSSMFERVIDEMGRIDVVVNNAGILDTAMRFDEMTVERWQRLFDVNVIGSFLCARAAVRHMSTRHGGEGGVIVNVSSAAAYLGGPMEYVDYAASKGAIDTFTIGLAREVAGEGIRVNAVRPGVIYTDIHASGGEPGRVDRVAPSVPMQRGGTAEEVAETILWLASDAASYVTGAIVNCTGGR